MAKSEVDAVTSKVIESGGILAKLYFDMESEKEEELQPLMTDLINNRLLKSPGVVYCFGSIDQPIKTEKSYSTNAVVTCLFKDIGSMINISFNFAPAGVEIIKPEKELRIKTNELQSLLLDIANVSINYSQYILSRVLSKDDYDKVMEDIKNREDLGKRLAEKKE